MTSASGAGSAASAMVFFGAGKDCGVEAEAIRRELRGKKA